MARNNYKGIKIDSANGIFVEVTITGLSDLQKHVGGLICLAHTWENGDVLFVDDEGLVKGHRRGFKLTGAHQPFVGNGIIVGAEVYDNDGECIDNKDPVMTIDLLKQLIDFGEVR